MVPDLFAYLTTRAGIDCRLLCDGENLLLLKANQLKKIAVPLGQHILQYVSVENPALCVERVMDFSMAGRNYLLLLDDMKRVIEQELKTRKREEVEAQEKARKKAEAEAEARARAEAEIREEARRKAEAEARAKEDAEEKAKAEARARAEAEMESLPKTIRIQCTDGSGGRYEGLVKDGQPFGKGTAYYDNGDVYSGDWQRGVFEGYGSYTWADGRKYEGEWKNDNKNGRGILYFVSDNGARYEGEFADGAFNGHGVFICNSYRVGAIWKDGQIEGSYRKYYPDGSFEDCENGWLTVRNTICTDGKVTKSDGNICFYNRDKCLVSTYHTEDCKGYRCFVYSFSGLVYYEKDYSGNKRPRVYNNEVYLDGSPFSQLYERIPQDAEVKKHQLATCLYNEWMHAGDSPFLYLLYKGTKCIYLNGLRQTVIDHLKSSVSHDLIDLYFGDIDRLTGKEFHKRKEQNYYREDFPMSFDGDYYKDERTGIRYYIIKVIIRDLPDYILEFIK